VKTATGVRRRVSLLVPVAVVATVATVVLGACGSDAGGLRTGGVAAEIGGVTVKTEAVVKSVDEALKAGPDVTDRAVLSRQYLSLQIELALLREQAKALGVTLTEQDRGAAKSGLETRNAQGSDLLTAARKAGYTPDAVNDIIELVAFQDVLSKKLGEKPATKAETDEIKAGQQQPLQAQAHSAHILVKDEASANKILADLRNGGDFAALAKQYSIDPSGKDNGGDLGTGPPGRFVPEFDKALFAAKEGEIVGPVKTQFGYHIIKLLELQTVDEQAAEQVGGARLVAAVAKGSKVKVNPRFGTWDAQRQIVIANAVDTNSPSSPSAAAVVRSGAPLPASVSPQPAASPSK
jgi:parvulin-like peptidyl-prolyl isomerase